MTKHKYIHIWGESCSYHKVYKSASPLGQKLQGEYKKNINTCKDYNYYLQLNKRIIYKVEIENFLYVLP